MIHRIASRNSLALDEDAMERQDLTSGRISDILAVEIFVSTSDFLPDIPSELLVRGLKAYEWEKWMGDELQLVHRTRRPKEKENFWCEIVQIIHALLLPVIQFFKQQGRFIRSWNWVLLEWQERFNSECLSRYGIFCKTLSSSKRVCMDERECCGLVEFTCTPESTEYLGIDPSIVDGPTNNCAWCWHKPEKDLCMLPEHEEVTWKFPS